MAARIVGKLDNGTITGDKVMNNQHFQVIEWGHRGDLIGCIGFRVRDVISVYTATSIESYAIDDMKLETSKNWENIKVYILPKGTKFEVTV